MNVNSTKTISFTNSFISLAKVDNSNKWHKVSKIITQQKPESRTKELGIAMVSMLAVWSCGVLCVVPASSSRDLQFSIQNPQRHEAIWSL